MLSVEPRRHKAADERQTWDWPRTSCVTVGMVPSHRGTGGGAILPAEPHAAAHVNCASCSELVPTGLTCLHVERSVNLDHKCDAWGFELGAEH